MIAQISVFATWPLEKTPSQASFNSTSSVIMLLSLNLVPVFFSLVFLTSFYLFFYTETDLKVKRYLRCGILLVNWISEWKRQRLVESLFALLLSVQL